MNEIKAVYYPYSIMPDRLLKQVILYFDEITVCLPKYFEIPIEYQYLYENKLINIYKKDLRPGVQPEIQQKFQEYQQGAQENQQKYRQIGQEIKRLHKLQGVDESQETQELRKQVQEEQQKLEQSIKELFQARWVLPQEKRQKFTQFLYMENLLPQEAFLSKDFLIEERVSAHFGLLSESYNSGQIPFTDNPKAQETFLKVFQTNVEKKENAAVLHEVLRGHKTGYLAKEIMKDHLSPLPGFETKSHQDILELKERLKDDLEDFKLELRTLVADIKCTPWDDSFQGEIMGVIDKLNKKVRELEKRKKKDSFISKLLKLGGPTASVIMGLNATTNISTSLFLEIVGLGIGAPIAGEWLEARTRKQSEYNGLNFLIELKEELS